MDRLGAMEAFVLAVETGSFSAVARRLHLGQPAISKLIAQQEEKLGCRLLLRSTRGLTPTEAGEAYYLRARQILDDIREAEAAVELCRTGVSGRLRISAPVTFARLHIIPHLPVFLAAHPNLAIEIQLDDRNVDLISGGIDVALRLGEQSDSGVVARKLADCAMSVVGTPAWFASRGLPVSPRELQDHPLVLYSPQPGMSQQWLFCRGEEQVVFTGQGRLTVSAAEGVRAAVLAGVGPGIGSEWMFAPELASGEVIRVLPEWQLPRLSLWALFPAGRQSSAKSRAFVAFVAALAGLQRTADKEQGHSSVE
ncbi:LysR family transcriptional regulator [Aeromonas rivuli]|uniref:LysR family transcriptional regulator n=1 Tax=Aeromonas rivuli TaxID=648794 RepID=UPI0005AB4A28|nr:LysR family transcriptional regulator [Aeromonas rivuli]